jgi:exodeoxyribonuclease V beta subunit
MKPQVVHAAPLSGVNVIEASAGTGKTWTIAGLYLRLLVEKQAPVEGILAITFTRAATAELRERIRTRLQELLDALDGRSPSDELIGWLLTRIADVPRARAHLTASLRGFDEAPIQTIHGFCQRALAEHAFSSGIAFDCELVPDIGDVLHEVAADFWRNRFCIDTGANAELIAGWMAGDDRTLAALEGWAMRYVRNPGLTLRRRPAGEPLDAVLDRYRATLGGARPFGKIEGKPSKEELAARDALSAYWNDACLDFVGHAHERIAQRFAERNAQSYDDLLLKLQRALAGAGGETLVRALRERFPYALIDEFQDTDPVQWGIFRTIYNSADPDCHAAFLVGDPKQSIYGFRGADVYAYLDAVGGRGEPLRLAQNQRSVPGLVRATNALFGVAANPFRVDAIRFEPVVAAPRARDALVDGGSDAAPLRIALAPPKDKGAPQNRMWGRAWACRLLVDEIARLLAGGADGSIRLGARGLRAGDIAVLVNDRYRAADARDALAAHGIACAEISNETVFRSSESDQLERVLLAVAAPKDSGHIRGALVTDLVGLTATQLLALEADAEWEAVLAEFDGYHQTWRTHGLMRMLRDFFRARRVPANLARYRDGERRLTNLYHLCELLHQAEQQLHGLDALVSWLAGRRDDAVTEEAQLRLESDANLVQIVTIHKSKGLEYPVTFVPFLWDVKSHVDDEGIVAHHADTPPHGLVLDSGSANFDQAVSAARDEELAEKVRMAYVALTRAKNRCYLFTGALLGNEFSALGWLLHSTDRKQVKAKLPRDAAALSAQIEHLRAAAPGDVGWLEAGAGGRQLSMTLAAAPMLAARTHVRDIAPGFGLSSFSNLRLSVARDDDDPLPDHDQEQPALAPVAAPLAPGGQRFAFPKGSDAGVCLHAMLEHLDFAAPSATVVRDQLARAGYPPAWSGEVIEWLGEVLQAPMPDPAGGAPIRLVDIERASALRELSFHLAVREFAPRRVAGIAAAHGVAVVELSRERLDGYLSGFIDLVFRHRGRWYVADYKSNWLGADAGAYGADAVSEAMAEGDYHLQYLLYTVALHRWLRSRDPAYDYDAHFGGTLYLFLRGMHPQWGGSGVFASKPPRALIEALDDCLGAVK